jgi:hypothetical protein
MVVVMVVVVVVMMCRITANNMVARMRGTSSHELQAR